MSSTVEQKKVVKIGEREFSLADVRHQILSFGNQIHEYLSKVEADVEGYRFSIEKHGDGVEVEVQFKALIHPKLAASEVIPR